MSEVLEKTKPHAIKRRFLIVLTNLGFSFQQASLNQSPIMKTSPFLDPGYPTKTLHSMNPGVETLDFKTPGAEILGP